MGERGTWKVQTSRNAVLPARQRGSDGDGRVRWGAGKVASRYTYVPSIVVYQVHTVPWYDLWFDPAGEAPMGRV